ncbi:MAG TPA: Smr/MutS family protein [Longimicrobiaceae bacterium]|nr:Smr/MutS family protein [Longimicrobiaceae bacterium]
MAPRKRRRSGTPPPPIPAWDEVLPTLDLHRETADEAVRRTGSWLRERQREGVRTVRVVTGRGSRSAGPPVLRGEVGALLEGLRGSLVSYFTLDSGGGAFRVELERFRAAPRLPAAPALLRKVDPDLRRRAEEALWELGVTPTPPLLATEIRRILREAGEEP